MKGQGRSAQPAASQSSCHEQIVAGFFKPVPFHILGTDGDDIGARYVFAKIRQAQAAFLSDRGFVVEPLELLGLDRVLELWWFFFGHVIAHLLNASLAGQESQLSPMLREYLSNATSPEPLSLDQFLQACVERDVLREKILRQMANVHILLSPVSSAPAFRHGEGSYQAGTGYLDTMRFSQWLNLAGFPGASVPIGFSNEGLPIGVQIIGRPFEEELILAVAEALEQSRGPWHSPPLP